MLSVSRVTDPFSWACRRTGVCGVIKARPCRVMESGACRMWQVMEGGACLFQQDHSLAVLIQ